MITNRDITLNPVAPTVLAQTERSFVFDRINSVFKVPIFCYRYHGYSQNTIVNLSWTFSLILLTLMKGNEEFLLGSAKAILF